MPEKQKPAPTEPAERLSPELQETYERYKSEWPSISQRNPILDKYSSGETQKLLVSYVYIRRHAKYFRDEVAAELALALMHLNLLVCALPGAKEGLPDPQNRTIDWAKQRQVDDWYAGFRDPGLDPKNINIETGTNFHSRENLSYEQWTPTYLADKMVEFRKNVAHVRRICKEGIDVCLKISKNLQMIARTYEYGDSDVAKAIRELNLPPLSPNIGNR